MKQNINNKDTLNVYSTIKAGVEIKICGMKFSENIIELGSLLPNYMGFIFWEKSARYFDGVIPDLPKSVKKVGVFVDETIEVILAKAIRHDLQAIQLHGKESAEYCSILKQKISKDIAIIKVFSISDEFDFDHLEPFESACDYFLFDTKGKLPGGNGFTFDWKVLENYSSKKPFFLSGGIGPEEINSIKEILKLQLPIHALDLNSKFETMPGLKDKILFKNFKKNLNI